MWRHSEHRDVDPVLHGRATLAAQRMNTARAQRWYERAGAGRWGLAPEVFAAAVERSIRHSHGGPTPDEAVQERAAAALHLDDLALATACADGREAAWEHFIREFRPALYRAADALDPAGSARDLADALYADLFGLRERDGERQSLFRYYHGRSSLATWLRAVLAQRYVDRHRSARRVEPLPDDESAAPLRAVSSEPDPDRERLRALLVAALTAALAALTARDRLRLACYYAQELTLAQAGKLLGEHEATTSRQLARTRKAIREDVERRLRDEHRLSPPEIAGCFEAVMADAGALHVGELLAGDETARAGKRLAGDETMRAGKRLAGDEPCKESPWDRSR
jgi:RNA polymerase sigma-70 factor (ECF subfamily)